MKEHLSSRVIDGTNLEERLNAFLATIRPDQLHQICRYRSGIIILYKDENVLPDNLELYLEEVERSILARALRLAFGDVNDAASELNMLPPDYKRKLRKHGIAFNVRNSSSERRKAVRLNMSDLPINLNGHLAERERHLIVLALRKWQGNQGQAAMNLGLKGRSTLQYKIKKYNIKPGEYLTSDDSLEPLQEEVTIPEEAD